MKLIKLRYFFCLVMSVFSRGQVMAGDMDEIVSNCGVCLPCLPDCPVIHSESICESKGITLCSDGLAPEFCQQKNCDIHAAYVCCKP